ncbi:hypothetical protein DBR42_20525 [Pelomonas sp. HMWF004]|nr:hypothetical protein DBR42_20525 [Pelomonas sp. HMWF004]
MSFRFDDLVREVEILLHGERIRIPQEKTDIPGLWVVQGDEFRAALGDHFKVFYAMFFGVLLEALKKGEVRLPIEGISLSDIDIAYQDGTLNTLAERIARSKPDSSPRAG